MRGIDLRGNAKRGNGLRVIVTQPLHCYCNIVDSLSKSVSRIVWLRSLALLVFCCISLAVLSYMFLFLVIMDYQIIECLE